MKIESLRSLELVLRLLRKHGVLEATVDGMTFKLSEALPKKLKTEPTTDTIDSAAPYTDEQLLMWSANG